MAEDHSIFTVCRSLSKIGLEYEPDWLALVLFARNIVPHLSFLDEDRKSDLQEMVMNRIKLRVFTPEAFAELVADMEEIIHPTPSEPGSPESLQGEREFSERLITELNDVLAEAKRTATEREVSVSSFGERTIDKVVSGEGRQILVEGIKAEIEHLVKELRSDARMWENRAKTLEEQMLYDSLLTNLHNRRSLDAFLAKAVRAHRESGEPLTLLMIDVDHFKANINDRYGHQVGDNALKTLGRIVQIHARQSGGFAARYGGEELVVAFGGFGAREAAGRAEALRVHVEASGFKAKRDLGDPEETVNFTVSIGVASLQPGWGPEDFLHAADKAMYRAKENGRNRVEVFSPDTP